MHTPHNYFVATQSKESVYKPAIESGRFSRRSKLFPATVYEENSRVKWEPETDYRPILWAANTQHLHSTRMGSSAIYARTKELFRNQWGVNAAVFFFLLLFIFIIFCYVVVFSIIITFFCSWRWIKTVWEERVFWKMLLWTLSREFADRCICITGLVGKFASFHVVFMVHYKSGIAGLWGKLTGVWQIRNIVCISAKFR